MLSPTDDLTSHPYDIATGFDTVRMRYVYENLSPTDEIVSHPYEIGILLLCHTDEMLSRPYEISTDVKPYGGVNKSYV